MRKLFITSTLLMAFPFLFLASLVALLLFFHQASKGIVSQRALAYAALPSFQNDLGASITQKDGRVERIRQFLAKYNSPLEPYAKDVVDSADQYGLDFRLIPAIAMQESNLCLKAPTESYNCWGFGIYGKTVTRFPSYKEGIYTVTKALATRYKDKGLVTPDEIMTMYTPSSNGSWAYGVNHFMAALE